MRSHPSRDVWIEMIVFPELSRGSRSHPSRDVWIEINQTVNCGTIMNGRIPHGMCGLK